MRTDTMPTDTIPPTVVHAVSETDGRRHPHDPLATALALLRTELGAEVVHDGQVDTCPFCTEQDDRVAA